MRAPTAFHVLLAAFGLLGISQNARAIDVTSNANAGAGTLRDAIERVNNNTAAGPINIVIAGVPTITLTQPLPAITRAVTIDATTQSGYGGNPVVQLIGTATPAGTHGFVVSTGSVTIKGFSIQGFPGDGIRIAGSGNTVLANWIGLNTAGNAAGNGANGVHVTGSDNRVEANTISSNGTDGIRIDQATSLRNLVYSNRIGTDPTATAARPNAFNGIVVSGARDSQIGGDAPLGNIISGNTTNGVAIIAGATGTTLIRNLIGVASGGAAPLGNRSNGVIIIESPGNTIGGAAAGQFNVISANTLSGIEIRGAAATGNVVQRALIGLDLLGGTDLGNGDHGVWLRGSQTTIGTGAVGAGGNVISGNGDDGIRIGESSTAPNAGANSIYGNYIGTNAAGTAAIPNAVGVHVVGYATNNRIGLSGIGNVISGNAGSGVVLDGPSGPNGVVANLITANLIGTTAAGSAALGNGLDGITLAGYSDTTRIGNTGTAGNVISGNGRHGVFIDLSNSFNETIIENNRVGLGSDGSALGNAQTGIRMRSSSDITLRANLISANGALGIDVGDEGVSPNDASDFDPDSLNFPVFNSAVVVGSTTTLTGVLPTKPTFTYRVEFFASATCDPSGHGEGATFLRGINVQADSNGDAPFSVDISGWPVGTVFTATATFASVSDDSSEFSPCIVSTNPPAVIEFELPASTHPETAGTVPIAIKRTGFTANAVTFNVASISGTAMSGSDYQTVLGQLSLAPGQTSTSAALTLLDDGLFENTEDMRVLLVNPSDGAQIGAVNSHTVSITSDEAQPTLAVVPCTVTEDAGTPCTFVVTATPRSAYAIAFDTGTTAGTAGAGDYSGHGAVRRTIAAGQPQTTVDVPVAADALYEHAETFTLDVATVSGAAPGYVSATGTIANDDGPPDFTIDPCVVQEMNSGTTPCTFVVKTNPAAPAERAIEVYYFTDSDDNRLGTAENASAEAPAAPASYGENATFGAWTVESGNIDLKHASVMQPAHGRQLIDLHGNMPGTIYADVPTEIGQQYTVSFAYSGHPDLSCLTPASTMDAYFGAQLLGGFSFDATGNTPQSMGWRYESRIVFATGTTTRLKFVGTRPGSCGAHIDDIAVMPVGGASSGLDFVPTFPALAAPVVLQPGVVQYEVHVPVRGDTLDEADTEDFTLRVCLKDGVCHTAPASIMDDDDPPSNAIFANGFE